MKETLYSVYVRTPGGEGGHGEGRQYEHRIPAEQQASRCQNRCTLHFYILIKVLQYTPTVDIVKVQCIERDKIMD